MFAGGAFQPNDYFRAQDHAVYILCYYHAAHDCRIALLCPIEERGRRGAEENNAVHSLRNGISSSASRLRHFGWAGRHLREPGVGSYRSRIIFPFYDCRYFGQGNHVFNVVGRANNFKSVGNGISLIIFAGIVANLPSALVGTLELGRTGSLSAAFIIFLIVMSIAVIALIVYVERGQRRLVVQYPKRQVGNRMFGGESSHLPLKINTAGVIPPIFASSLLLLPITIAGFSAGQGPEWLNAAVAYLGRGQPFYLLTYSLLIAFFAFFTHPLFLILPKQRII